MIVDHTMPIYAVLFFFLFFDQIVQGGSNERISFKCLIVTVLMSIFIPSIRKELFLIFNKM